MVQSAQHGMISTVWSVWSLQHDDAASKDGALHDTAQHEVTSYITAQHDYCHVKCIMKCCGESASLKLQAG